MNPDAQRKIARGPAARKTAANRRVGLRPAPSRRRTIVKTYGAGAKYKTPNVELLSSTTGPADRGVATQHGPGGRPLPVAGTGPLTEQSRARLDPGHGS